MCFAGNARIFPLNGRSVFISVLKRLGVLVLQCDFEADGDLAFLAMIANTFWVISSASAEFRVRLPLARKEEDQAGRG